MFLTSFVLQVAFKLLFVCTKVHDLYSALMAWPDDSPQRPRNITYLSTTISEGSKICKRASRWSCEGHASLQEHDMSNTSHPIHLVSDVNSRDNCSP